jgi:hypothetical protein
MNVYFQLYASNGTTPQYLFPVVFDANYPHTEKNLIEHTNIRGKGSIVVSGGDSAWDITLKGVLFAADYEALTVLIDAMESSVALNTPYVLKINKTSSTYYSYNVKRIVPIEWQSNNLRTNFMEFTCTLRVLSW